MVNLILKKTSKINHVDYNVVARFSPLTIKSISMTGSKTHVCVDTYRKVICWRGLKWLGEKNSMVLGWKSIHQLIPVLFSYGQQLSTYNIILQYSSVRPRSDSEIRRGFLCFLTPPFAISPVLVKQEWWEGERHWIGLTASSSVSNFLLSFSSYLSVVFPHFQMFRIPHFSFQWRVPLPPSLLNKTTKTL